MREITVAVIGAGSTYCPELIDGFLKARASLCLRRIVLMDIDARKLRIVGGLCLRMLRAAGVDCEAILSDDLKEALRGADFVITQIRVGKLPARHLDETIPLKYGFIGQETTGIGGFFKALRTIPAMAHICRQMELLCPNAWLINFTNPSGIVTEFVLNRTRVKCIGLCNCPINMLDDTRAEAGEDAEITYIGLNHLSWITSVKLPGKGDVLPQFLRAGFRTKVMENIRDDGFSMECLRAVGGVPTSYLQYYYGREAKLRHMLTEPKSRAQVCMEIEEQLLEMYASENLCTKPALLDKRGGHKYSLAAVSLIDSIANDKRDVHVVNLLNRGTLPFMEDDDAVELAAVIGKNGAAPIVPEPLENLHIISLMRTVKSYERYTVEAAVTGNEDAAMNALLLHPLVGDWEKAYACFQEMKQAHKAYLPQFAASTPGNCLNERADIPISTVSSSQKE
ncbi:MAG: 6-phospho-beta-glucosidase [Oscillospiraceae bacterium]|jgi:6-phospho-beta-glucosidase|nr:6-phospho-beta-glucosidase [Oscillospiraceae bacterium]